MEKQKSKSVMKSITEAVGVVRWWQEYTQYQLFKKIKEEGNEEKGDNNITGLSYESYGEIELEVIGNIYENPELLKEIS
jgi:hypothetical protein